LDFVPLFEEPYEIVVPLGLLSDASFNPFFEYLNSGEFRDSVRNLDGYTVPQDFGGVEVIY
jgi:molybdate-binding protein